ncbi:hypothetical protein EYZ11_002033 [Aspergillus tanneri]|uniref:Uncharacterized protein n=1 Tax=Aspergillus tanneri TaxID=1220188 RepID=A0A4S3JSA8_9EURO|nr:hypothetical protein EYZ11_002033 [Aspergillus tanneri]
MSFQHLERIILQYYDGDYFTVIPRPLILDPILALLRELRERADGENFLEALHVNAEQNLHRKFPSITVQTSVDDFLGYFTGHNFRMEFVGLIFALAGVASSYVEVEDAFAQQDFAADMRHVVSPI